MQKYTIIYGEYICRGSISATMIKMDRVTSDNIAETIKDEKYCDNVTFIFMGWPELEGENKAKN